MNVSFHRPAALPAPRTIQQWLWSVGIVISTPLLAVSASAQVPQLINYQGRIAVDNINFDGSGQFKFALLDGSGGASYWSNAPDVAPVDGVPDAAVVLPVSKGLYSVLLGDATLSNMKVIPATVFTHPDVRLRVWFNDGSHGWQQLTPDQRIAAVGYAMMSANVPDGAITSAKIAPGAVTESQLAVGAVGGTHMAPGAAAANLAAGGQSGVAGGGVILAEDPNNQNLIDAGYIKIGAVEMQDSWERRIDNPAPSARSSHTMISTGTEVIIWGGWDGYHIDNCYGGLNDGARYDPVSNSWTRISTVNAPSVRFDHTAVWTGTEMIVWGGKAELWDEKWVSTDPMQGGGRYNPVTDAWSSMSRNGEPLSWGFEWPYIPLTQYAFWTGTSMIILGHSSATTGCYDPQSDTWSTIAASGLTGGPAVWTGSELIAWDGTGGGRYNPATNLWSPMSASGAPSARSDHSLVWTGNEMIVWGGRNSTAYKNDGARYNPSSDQWSPLPTSGAPSGRSEHAAVWTGSEMIVYSGRDGSSETPNLVTGGRYRPSSNSWTTMGPSPEYIGSYHSWIGGQWVLWNNGVGYRYNPTTNAWQALPTQPGTPSQRSGHTAVWTGSEMIIWGGSDGSSRLGTGSRYDPVANLWSTVSTVDAPAARYQHAAIWTHTHMVIWGGYGAGYLNTGGSYNPATDSWTSISTTAAPSARTGPSMVNAPLLGGVIVWGGFDGANYLNTGSVFKLSSNTWTALPTASAPSGRWLHSAVWTGSDMIVWGGTNGTGSLGDGSFLTWYYSTTPQWITMPASDAPSPRHWHSTVWTGSEMIVWGGFQFDQATGTSQYLNDGARFQPLIDNRWIGWVPINSTGAPKGRDWHTAVWTGKEMVVWGGLSEDGLLRDGGRYDPFANVWKETSTSGAPSGRQYHSAVWTGSEMLIFGGYNGVRLDDLFSYRPARSLHLYQRP